MDPHRAEEELRHWLALYRAPGIGARTYARLLEAFGSPADVLGAGVAELSASGLPAEVADYLRAPDWPGVDADLRWLAQARRAVLTIRDARYPPPLLEIADPPPLLFVEGDVDVLRSTQIAVVGSRSPTAGGVDLARDFSATLAARGFTITSGLALGVDAASHRGALACAGVTIAVTGTGLDRVYPRQHEQLAARIAERGALVSEFPTGTPVLRENFPRRNRIISGLSVGVLVVEAARTSGSLITARHAMEQGREVFAIPGSVHNPLARGCHALIREGAKLVEGVEDIVEELTPIDAPAASPATPSAPSSLSVEQQRLLDAIGYEPVTIDTLVGRCGLTANAVSSILLILELEGHVSSQPGGRYARRRPRG